MQGDPGCEYVSGDWCSLGFFRAETKMMRKLLGFGDVLYTVKMCCCLSLRLVKVFLHRLTFLHKTYNYLGKLERPQ